MKEIIRKIKSDYHRYTGKGNQSFFKIILYLLFARNHPFNYSFWLRAAHRTDLLWPLAVFMRRRLSIKYSLDIPRECEIGYGLYLSHGICMVINSGTVIGNNVNLSQFLNIGTNHGTPAVIGDNVYIGPNVCIVEDVHIGNNSNIGAGAVVTKDVPRRATVEGGYRERNRRRQVSASLQIMAIRGDLDIIRAGMRGKFHKKSLLR